MVDEFADDGRDAECDERDERCAAGSLMMAWEGLLLWVLATEACSMQTRWMRCAMRFGAVRERVPVR